MKRTTKKKAVRTRRGKALITVDYSGLARAEGTAAWWKKLANNIYSSRGSEEMKTLTEQGSQDILSQPFN